MTTLQEITEQPRQPLLRIWRELNARKQDDQNDQGSTVIEASEEETDQESSN